MNKELLKEWKYVHALRTQRFTSRRITYKDIGKLLGKSATSAWQKHQAYYRYLKREEEPIDPKRVVKNPKKSNN